MAKAAETRVELAECYAHGNCLGQLINESAVGCTDACVSDGAVGVSLRHSPVICAIALRISRHIDVETVTAIGHSFRKLITNGTDDSCVRRVGSEAHSPHPAIWKNRSPGNFPPRH